jgi:CheY-like chemotaxis protein
MSNFRKGVVLVVDDDPGVRELVSTTLEGAGFVVYQAEDGLGALAILGGLLPDAIISDLEMPRMSGYELVLVVRRRFPQLPVVVLSGVAESEKVPLEIGANVYLRKGEFQPTELCERISELVQARDSLPRQDADQAASAAMARLD